MSGGPPHHSAHGRQMPSAASNAAWNHLQVPNYYPPRHPQHAHTSSAASMGGGGGMPPTVSANSSVDHQLLLQPTWHTPTANAPPPMGPAHHQSAHSTGASVGGGHSSGGSDAMMKSAAAAAFAQHSQHIFNLEQMLSAGAVAAAAAAAADARSYHHHHQSGSGTSLHYAPPPGVDLTLARNGQNGNDPPMTTPSTSSSSNYHHSSMSGGGGGVTVNQSQAPISLSVRDANKINSLAALEIQATGLGGTSDQHHKAAALSPVAHHAAAAHHLLSRTPPPSNHRGSVAAALSPQGLLKQQIVAHNNAPPSQSPGLRASPGLTPSPRPRSAPSPFAPAAHSPIMNRASPALRDCNAGSPLTVTKQCPGSPASVHCNDKAVPSPPSALKKAKRVDSILERLNPVPEKPEPQTEAPAVAHVPTATPVGVIVQAGSSLHDENSNSRDDNSNSTGHERAASPYSTEDSLDSHKSTGQGSRRKRRQPNKTMRVPSPKEDAPKPDEGVTSAEMSVDEANTESRVKEVADETPCVEERVRPESQHVSTIVDGRIVENKVTERRKSAEDVVDGPELSPGRKTRRKTSSESETIDKIAAMVQETSKSVADSPKAVKELKDEAASVHNGAGHQMPGGLITLAQKKDFVAVEDKLEEMFAGLEDGLDDVHSQPTPNDTVDLLKLDESSLLDDCKPGEASSSITVAVPSESRIVEDEAAPGISGIGLSAKRAGTKKRKTIFRKGTSSDDETPKKRKSSKKSGKGGNQQTSSSRPSSAKKAATSTPKELSYDSGSNASSGQHRTRGPFVQIRGPRDSPLSVCVVNAAAAHDGDGEGGYGASAALKSRTYHSDDAEYRAKVRQRHGLHSSTLSNKYDAKTKDASWVCAFCKRGPYAGVDPSVPTPGELFGPYLITDRCAEYETRLTDPFDRNFRSKKVCRTLEAAAFAGATTPPSKGGGIGKGGSKRKLSESQDQTEPQQQQQQQLQQDMDVGIVPIVLGGLVGDHHSHRTFEVWTHEECAVWAPGVWLAGAGRVVGLEEAVWQCSRVTCVVCKTRGAAVCCRRRGCAKTAHYTCAAHAKWSLDVETYSAICDEHAIDAKTLKIT